MDNHSNIERNIGGGSAHNFNQKKVFGEGLAEYFYLKNVQAMGKSIGLIAFGKQEKVARCVVELEEVGD